MAKRIICIIFIFALCCSGCAVKPDGTTKPTSTPSAMCQPSSSAATKPTIPAPTIPLRPYNDPPILNIQHVYHQDEPDKRIILDEESASELMILFNEVEWVGGLFKLHGEYFFECNGFTLGYAASNGAFIDDQNDRSMELTQEQRAIVNRLIYKAFFPDDQVEPVAPAGCDQYIVELYGSTYSFEYLNADVSHSIYLAPKNEESFQSIKYEWEHQEEYKNYDIERSFDPEREAIIYRYTSKKGIEMMLVVYSFQTKEYSYTVYEEYELDTSEELPRHVKFLGTNDSDYFYVVVNWPTEQITKEWISQWGIQNGLMTEITA